MMDRKLFDTVLWILAGLSLLVLLTSCNPYADLFPVRPAATPAPATSTSTTSAPSRTQTPTPLPTYTVSVETLEIRTGPSESAGNVGYLERGALVTVYATVQADEYCQTWAKISPGARRWVCMEHLTKGE